MASFPLDDFEIIPPTDDMPPSEGSTDSEDDDNSDREYAARGYTDKTAEDDDDDNDDDDAPPPPDDGEDDDALDEQQQRRRTTRTRHEGEQEYGDAVVPPPHPDDRHHKRKSGGGGGSRKSRGNIRWGAPSLHASSSAAPGGASRVASDFSSSSSSSILFVERDAFAVQQALKYRSLMRPTPTPISTAEEASLLSLIENYLTANGLHRTVQQLRADPDTTQMCTSYHVPLASDRLASLRLPELDLDLPGLVKDTVRKTCLLFDDEVAWPADNLFSSQFPLTDSKAGSSSGTSGTPTSSPPSPPLTQTSLHQHASLTYLIEKLVLEQKDVPFTENGKFDVTYTNVFLVCSCYFSCPDTLFSLFSKIFKTVASQGALFGEARRTEILCRILVLLLGWVKCCAVDFTRLVLERIASFAVNIIHCSNSEHRNTSISGGGGGGGENDLVQIASEILSLIQKIMKHQVVYATSTSGGSTGELASDDHQQTNTNSITSCHWLRWCDLGEKTDRNARKPPTSASSARSDLPPSSMKMSDTVHYVTDIHDVELARHLTVVHSRLFHAIGIRELFHNAWTDVNLQHTSKNFLDFMNHFEDVSLWVASCIVTPPTQELRLGNFCKFIRVGKLLYDMQNFSLAQSVLNGMEHHTVAVLKRTTAALPAHEGDVLDALRLALDPQRQMQKSIPHTSVATACIPFLGPYISDVCTTEETKETFISCTTSSATAIGGDVAAASATAKLRDSRPTEEHAARPYQSTLMHINWSKMVEIGRVVCRLLAFQSVDYRFGVLPNVMAYVRQLPGKRDAEVLYALAKEREGKP